MVNLWPEAPRRRPQAAGGRSEPQPSKKKREMKIVKVKRIPLGKDFYALNLCGVLLTKGPLGPVELNHELIHTAQIKEMAYVLFYLWYVAEWLVRMVQYRGYTRGYFNISFEREAYACQNDLHYRAQRKPYSWTKYLVRPRRRSTQKK